MIKKIKVCPECHSTNIKEDWKLRGTIYECKKCGYRGVLILDVPVNMIKKLKEKNNRS